MVMVVGLPVPGPSGLPYMCDRGGIAIFNISAAVPGRHAKNRLLERCANTCVGGICADVHEKGDYHDTDLQCRFHSMLSSCAF